MVALASLAGDSGGLGQSNNGLQARIWFRSSEIIKNPNLRAEPKLLELTLKKRWLKTEEQGR